MLSVPNTEYGVVYYTNATYSVIVKRGSGLMGRKPTSASGAVKEVTTIRLDPEVKVALERVADADGRSVSSLIQKIINEWLKGKKLLK